MGADSSLPQVLRSGTAPKPQNFSAWALTPWGLEITFQDYQVGPYAAGNPSIYIPYSSLGPLLNPTGPASSIGASAQTLRTVLLPATSAPVVNECLQALVYSSAGPGPITCANGDLNVNAWNALDQYYDLGVMALPRTADLSAVRGTMCRDVHGKQYPTAGYEIIAEKIAAPTRGGTSLQARRSSFPTTVLRKLESSRLREFQFDPRPKA
jgi:hypothetical protein